MPIRATGLTSLKQSHSQSPKNLSLLRHFPTLSPFSSDHHHHHTRRISSSLRRFIYAVGLGSFLGFLSYYAARSRDTASFLAFADWATFAESESVTGEQNRRSLSFFPKLAFPDKSPKFLFGDAFRRKVFFKYEKRIRSRSPPEKVFEYCASFCTPDGELLMRPANLMWVVVPVFPPSESNLVRDGYLTGERSPGELRCAPSEFFMLFDVNSDGLISFKEYIFFVTLISIPESSFSVAFKMFDTDNNGEKRQRRI